MRAVARTETGLVRKINEDCYYCDLDAKLFVVADGMGGHLAGEVASKMAVEIIVNYSQNISISSAQSLWEAVSEANARIYANSLNNASRQGMGTTVTCAKVLDDKLILAHVGDSRAYLFNGKEIIHLTDDHSFVGELVRSGSITENEAQRHPKRNILLRALGAEEQVNIDIFEKSIKRGNLVLLCTDGLHNLLSDEEIYFILLEMKDLESAVDDMIKLAYSRGAGDNITIILIQI
ncbi:Stp1/IreP family PP2C-type Ser/Thr phosphatase [Bacillota bacterium LX-D]|nr:Stp1/IreP family PP2C-type Ser/Thr phosphatase [Bacillota bacterium LX-D]